MASCPGVRGRSEGTRIWDGRREEPEGLDGFLPASAASARSPAREAVGRSARSCGRAVESSGAGGVPGEVEARVGSGSPRNRGRAASIRECLA